MSYEPEHTTIAAAKLAAAKLAAAKLAATKLAAAVVATRIERASARLKAEYSTN